MSDNELDTQTEVNSNADLSTDTALLDGIPEAALESDPELREILAEEKNASGKDAKNKGAEVDLDKGGEPEPTDAGTDVDKNNEAEDALADDKNSGEDSIDDIEFADNVIEGLSGEDLKKLPQKALEALAAFVEKHSAVSGEAEKSSESLKGLLANPIVKKVLDLQSKGKSEFEVRGINDVERRSIIERLKNKIGIDDSEANAAFEVLKDGIDLAVKESAKETLLNMVLEDDRRFQQNETIKKGRSAFLGLGKFNKDLEFKETDPSKFWTTDGNGKDILDSKHPEAKKYAEKIYPAMTALAEKGLRYEHLAKMSDKEVYALVAAQSNLPIAFNTADRDKKIINSELRKKLSLFIKGNGSGELSVKSGLNVGGERSSSVIKHGYDIERLATDEKYYERALTAKAGDSAHMALVESLADEGETLLAKKQKPKK